MNPIDALLLGCSAYLALGLLIGVWFVSLRLQHDPAAADSGWGFRLLILPGCVALWPILLLRRTEESP